MHREVTPDQKLLSRRLLTKTNRMPRWAERLFPANVAHSVYILEDSIVDPQNQTMTTFTWNINHARLMVRPFGSPIPKRRLTTLHTSRHKGRKQNPGTCS